MVMMKKKKKHLKLKQHVAKPAEAESKPSAEELKQQSLFAEETRVKEAADRIRRINRPYSLGFGGLPARRQVTDSVQGKMLEQIETDKDSVTSTKRLLPKHPLVTKLGSSRNAIKILFDNLTLPYVVPGQRLFMFDDSKIDFEKWPLEQVEQEMARQRSEFETKINTVIAEYHTVIQEVVVGWPGILEAAKAKLKQLFDERDYLRADEIAARLSVEFGPEGVLEATTESRFMPAELRNLESQRMQDRFEAVVRLQEDTFINAFKKTLDQALKSISGVDDGSLTRLHSSVIENLFSTFVDFRNKCMRYGMLTGTRVEQAVQQCVKALDADNMQVDDVATFIKKSESRRKSAIESLNKVATTMAEVIGERANSRVIFRRDEEEEAVT